MDNKNIEKAEVDRKLKFISDPDFIKMTEEFNKLNSYEEKLKWWDINELRKEYYPHTYNSIGNSHNTKEVFEISIFPKGPAERKLYFDWMRKRNVGLSFETRKKHFDEKMNDSTNPQVTLDAEILKVKNKVLRIKGKTPPGERPMANYFWKGELIGYNASNKIEEIDFHDADLFEQYHLIGIIQGESLAKYERYIEMYDTKKIHTKKGNSKFGTFTLMEKMLIVSLFQDIGEFPKHDTRKGETQKQFQELLSLISGDSFDSIKDAYSKLDAIKNHKDLSRSTADSRLENLRKIRSFFQSIKHDLLIEKVDELSRAIELKRGQF